MPVEEIFVMSEWSSRDRCKDPSRWIGLILLVKAVQSPRDLSGSSVLLVRWEAVLTLFDFLLEQGEGCSDACSTPQGCQLANFRHSFTLPLKKAHHHRHESNRRCFMDMFKNLVYQTCKSFTYFSALLEAANCLWPQKNKKVLHQSPATCN